ncbi:reverse transcriptase domain-containing protein, partial [Tanacetum coccineum]
EITQEVLNVAAGGIFIYKTPNQAYQLLEDKVLLKLDWAKNQKTKSTLKKAVTFADGGSSNSDTDKIMARMDAMTLKMDAQYKELHSTAKKTKPDLYEDDIPMSREEEAKSGKSYNSPVNPNNQQDNFETPVNFDSDDEEDEPTPQPKTQNPKQTKETPLPKPYKPKISYPQRLRKEKMEAQYGKFLDIIRSVRINVPLIDVLVGMPNYGKFCKELISNKHKIEQISATFLNDESSAMIQNKVPPKLGDPRSFLIPCNFNKTLSCNALADLGASINLMSYSLYAKLSLETLKPTKMTLCHIHFMLVEVGKFTFPADFVILEMEKDSKVPLILGRPFLHTADAVIQVKRKQLNLGVGTERMIFITTQNFHQMKNQPIYDVFPNHLLPIEDTFSSMNILNYTSVSSDYFSASSESSSFNSSENSKDNIIPSVISPFYDNPCLKDVQAFYAKESPISPSDPITPPAILTPSPPTPPQIFEIGKSSSKIHLKHHENQIEDILNYLEELSFLRIGKMEEDNKLKTELEKVRSQIIKLQRKQLGQRDKIAFAHYRISNLEQSIEENQARHQTDQEDL